MHIHALCEAVIENKYSCYCFHISEQNLDLNIAISIRWFWVHNNVRGNGGLHIFHGWVREQMRGEQVGAAEN